MTERLRVLYAEDNAADADLTRAHVAAAAPSITLDIVNTGQACLERLRGGGYDVLLLDNHLPDMEGVEVLKAVAANGSALPVVMVTGVGDEHLVVQVIRLGAQNYVPKQGDYLERLPEVLARAVSEHRARAAAGRGARRSRRILYVEHDLADIDLTATHFAEAASHFTLEVVRTAAAALSRLAAGGIDLVVTDLRLPDMNALDLLTEARQRRRLSVPFIVITGMGDEQAAVAALTLGASDYIVKRDNYLVHLPYAIDNAISRFELLDINRRLEAELGERARLAAENARLFAGAQDALRARDEFLSIAAHEIRGPLTAMRLAVQSLRKGKVPARALPVIFDIIEREDRKLAQFVDELLDLGRIRAGTLHFDFATVDLAEVVREVTTRLEGELTQAGSSVGVTAEGPLTGEWDRSRLDQVVSNLLSNAIKFGLGHPIEIGLTGGASQVRLQIKDGGAGIPEDQRAQIFTPFERELSVRNYGGLGLGLHIVRTIVDGLGGTLEVDSVPGSGSTFTVSLPRTRTAH